MFFTDILPFGPNSKQTPEPTTEGDTSTPEPVTESSTTPDETPDTPSGPFGGQGGEVRVTGETEYTFTPDNSGVWEIRSSDSNGSDPYLKLLDSNGAILDDDDDGAGDKNALIHIYLHAGTTYTIEAGFYEGGPGNYNLTISTATPIPIPGGGGRVFVDNRSVFLLIPNQSGTWELRTSDNLESDPLLEVLDIDGTLLAMDDDGMGDDSSNAFISLDLEAGKSYLVFAKYYDKRSGGYMLEIISPSGTTINDGGIIAGSGETIDVTGATMFTFTPDKSGIWEFRTSDNGDSDPNLEIHDSNGLLVGADDDGAGNKNALMIINLYAGETYSLKAGFYRGTGSFKLKVSQCVVIPEDGGDVIITEPSVCVFTPGQSGAWEFRTSDSGSSDPILELHDAAGNLIAEDDDSAGGHDALITAELEAGEMYLIYTRFYEVGKGSYTLNVGRGE